MDANRKETSWHMNKIPRVSVVMAVYNGALYLREAVESILNQTFNDFEFIVIDDGSTDNTSAILDSLNDPRMVLLRNQQNEGLPASLNRGLQVAKGEYFARQDADDVSMVDRFTNQVAYLDSHPKVGLLGCWAKIIGEAGKTIRISKKPQSNEEIQNRLHRSSGLVHGSVMFRRTYLEQAGFYRSIFRRAQDRDLWLRMAKVCEIHNLPETLYKWRFNPDAYTVSRTIRHGRYSLLAVEVNKKSNFLTDEKKIQTFVERRLNPGFFSSYGWKGRQYIAGICRYWAAFMLSQKLYGKGWKLFVVALFFNPLDRSLWRILYNQLFRNKTLGMLVKKLFGII